MPRDLPILMSAPMVKACLREVERPGTGKTQTRRILKPQPHIQPVLNDEDPAAPFWCVWKGDEVGYRVPVRFAKGDRLWVRESWAKPFAGDNGYIFRADGPEFNSPATAKHQWGKGAPWRVSIHMPRIASRLTLTVTEVRVERLQAISEADAIAEGLQAVTAGNGHVTYQIAGLLCGQTAVRAYRLLWDTINGDGAWAANPWVVAVTFKPERRNIDHV